MDGTEAIASSRSAVLAPETAIPLGILVLDQISKAWVREELTLGEPISIIGDYVRLMFIHNEGAAFGLTVGSYTSMIFLILATLASAMVLYLYLTTPVSERLQRVALALILGGALGNIIDRVRWDMVVDFIQVGVAGHYWPIFNLADSAVTIGAVLLAYSYLFKGAPSEST